MASLVVLSWLLLWLLQALLGADDERRGLVIQLLSLAVVQFFLDHPADLLDETVEPEDYCYAHGSCMGR